MANLSNIQEIIERSIFEKIRLLLVDQGYLPDIAAIDEFDNPIYPDTEEGWTQWETDIKNIVTTKGFAIELFNGGTSDARGVKKVPRIVMDPGNFLPGALGGDPRKFFKDQGTHFEALVTPPQTVDFYLNMCLVSNNIVQNRILNSVLGLALSRRGYVNWYNDSTKTFFIRYLNFYDNTTTRDNVIEHVYAYEIPDAWDREDLQVYAEVAKIEEITLETNVQKYMDGTWGYNTDPLVII